MFLKNLNTFIHAAEMGSFTKAGEKLGYAQSTVSSQIRQLEDELGVQLFERINHTIALTDRGREVLRYAHQIHRLTQEMAGSTQEDQSCAGHIRLATADSLCGLLLSERFTEFHRSYPEITLQIVTAGTKELFRLLDHNEADMVFTLDSRIYNTDYVTACEEKVGVHFIASSDSPLAEQKNIKIEELVRYPFLMTEKGMSYRRMLDEKLSAQSLEIQPILEVGSADLICRLVEQGAGMAFLPDYVTQRAAACGTIVYLDVCDFEVELWKQLLYHRDKWVSPPMRAVIEYLSR